MLVIRAAETDINAIFLVNSMESVNAMLLASRFQYSGQLVAAIMGDHQYD